SPTSKHDLVQLVRRAFSARPATHPDRIQPRCAVGAVAARTIDTEDRSRAPREGFLDRRQVSWLVDLPALPDRSFHLPSRMASGIWNELSTYSGGTAPAFDRLPSFARTCRANLRSLFDCQTARTIRKRHDLVNTSFAHAPMSVPFRLGTTSFIYPGGWADNVERLAGRVDDVEILFFESEGLPSVDEVRRLAELEQRTNLTFSLHTPLDVSLASANEPRRQQAVAAVQRAIEH